MQRLQVRAFAGWPGTRAKVVVFDKADGHLNILELKIITTRVCKDINSMQIESDDITFVNGALVIPCGGHTALEVYSVCFNIDSNGHISYLFICYWVGSFKHLLVHILFLM